MLAAAVGTDLVAVDVLAEAAGAATAGAAAAAGAAGVVAAAVSAAGVVLEAFCTPPWPLQAPFPVDVEELPSLHVVGLPEVAGAAGAVATGAGAAAAAEVLAAFCTPPCPLHAPFPVAVEVVPSLH